MARIHCVPSVQLGDCAQVYEPVHLYRFPKVFWRLRGDSPANAGDSYQFSFADWIGLDFDLLESQGGVTFSKENPGITGVSIAYIRSPNFLKGDGGIANVVWVDSALYERISSEFSPDQKVATEKDVKTMEKLRSFLGR